eukprot:TRINITY_DN87191_c0_g1_i1.p1 TRINITY_DN87191_c0_g1~~TRINITY_DN87191_c0_g1_i1.p1  ORF type:complete len:861 (+),score=94.98 TRINITY_DN87191_c0_g1_i1:86-2668(+)
MAPPAAPRSNAVEGIPASCSSRTSTAAACRSQTDDFPPSILSAVTEPDAEASIEGGEADSGRCSLCDARLGKRRLNPKHHCRLCQRCVCGACSSASVPITGQPGLHRACNACVSALSDSPEISARIRRIRRRLQELAAVDGNEVAVEAKGESRKILDILLLCEQSLEPLGQRLDDGMLAKARAERLHAESRSAQVVCKHLAGRLTALGQNGGQVTHVSEPASLAQAVALCETATLALEDAQPRRRSSFGMSRSRRNSSDGAEVYNIFTPRTSFDAADMYSNLRVPDSLRNGLLSGPLVEEGIEEGTHEVTADSAHANAAENSGRPTRRPCCRSKCFGRIVAMTVCMGILAGIALVGWLVLLPRYVQGEMDRASIILLRGNISDPRSQSMHVKAHAMLTSGCIANVRVGSFNATLAAGGRAFGWTVFPDVDLTPDGITHIVLDSRVHLTDHAAFAAGTSLISQGRPVEWTIKGSPTLKAPWIHVTVRLNKTFVLPAASLQRLSAANVDIVGGNKSTLHLTADTSFVSTSILELTSSQRTRFLLHPLAADGSPELGITLGTAFFPGFQMSRGYNMISNVSLFLHKAVDNERSISELIGRWASGLSQSVAICGPADSTSLAPPYMMTQVMQVSGAAQGLIKSGYVSSPHSFLGHDGKTGKACGLPGDRNCLRGAVVVARSVAHATLRLLDLSLDVNTVDNLTYKTVLHELLFPRTISCSSGKRLARLQSLPGMWSYIDQAKSQDASITLLSVETTANREAHTSFFLPGQPQPGQSSGHHCIAAGIDPMDCCFTTVLSAAACFYRKQDLSIIPVTFLGNMTMVVGEFQIRIAVSQSEVPFTYAEDVPNFQVGALRMSCSDFRWQ